MDDYLGEESANLCTINTRFCIYKFCRLPYGQNCAPEIFHCIMTEIFSVLEGVIVYIDDIIITGSRKEEHDKHLEKVLMKAREVNLKFNKSKCNFWVIFFILMVLNRILTKLEPFLCQVTKQ